MSSSQQQKLSYLDKLALLYEKYIRGAAHSAEIRVRLERVQNDMERLLASSDLADVEKQQIKKSLKAEFKFFDKEHKRLYKAFRRTLMQEQALHRIDLRMQRRQLRYRLLLITCVAAVLLGTYWLGQKWQIALPFIN